MTANGGLKHSGARNIRQLMVCGGVAIASVILAGHSFAEPPALDDAARLALARAASKDLAETLKGQLVAAIKSGGPASAINVCKTIAPNVTGDTAKKHALTIRRTSQKVRNPANAPDAFEARVLADFAAKIAAGTDPATLEHSETVTDGGSKTFRYMKAIPTAAEPCLACHGSDLKPEVKAEISKLYPDDKATGFKAGELRGAISVSQAAK